MFEARIVEAVNNNRLEITDPEVVYGHRVVQSQQAKWLCLDKIYQKFYRPSFYDIGGTYMQDVADYWFTYKTEQFGNIFLLHIFVCNHEMSSFSVALSSGNKLKHDRKSSIVYLQEYLKEFQFKQLREMSHSYLTTYHFSEQDVESLKDKRLYIAVTFPFSQTEEVSLDVIDNIKLSHDFGALLADPIASDFTIESADGVKFQIHKVIFTAHSEVFKAMLKAETAESQNSYVKLIDVAGHDLRHMLEYIYTGTLKDIENINFGNLLMLADKYNLKGLWELSQYALYEQLSIENCSDILVIADLYDSEFLKAEAMKFMKENKEEVIKSGVLGEISSADLLRQLCSYLAL